jgi:hypothetical protein
MQNLRVKALEACRKLILLDEEEEKADKAVCRVPICWDAWHDIQFRATQRRPSSDFFGSMLFHKLHCACGLLRRNT